MNIQFRDLQESDLPQVKEIYDWYIARSTATFHTEPIQQEQLREFIFINHPLYRSYMIYYGDDLAGYCYLTFHKKRQAYDRTAEVTLYLKPECTRQGLGSAALNHLEGVARQKGLKNLVGVITGDNESSIALFAKCGYTKCAHFRNVGEKFGKVLDVVAFQKEL